VKAFHALTDDELEIERRIGDDQLVKHYRLLRDHHVAETAHLAARDRSAILRMAGNIAAGFADPRLGDGMDYVNAKHEAAIAARAVRIARQITAEVDAASPQTEDSFERGYDQAVQEIRDHFAKAGSKAVAVDIDRIWSSPTRVTRQSR
jgi:hypothetical protein